MPTEPVFSAPASSPSPGAPSAGGRRATIAPLSPWVALVLGALLSALAFAVARRIESQKIERVFAKAADVRCAAVEEALSEVPDFLHALRALWSASNRVERTEYRAFTHEMLRGCPGLRSVDWVPRVPNDARDVWVQRAHAEGVKDFEVRELDQRGELVTAAARPVYYPVFFAEPEPADTELLGVDLGASSEHMATLSRACDSGEAQTALSLIPPQDAGDPLTFITALAIYVSGKPAEDPAERRANLKGFVTVSFEVGALLAPVLEADPAGAIALHVFADSAVPGERLIYSWRPPADGASDPNPTAREIEAFSGLRTRRPIDVGGREWQLWCDAVPGYVAARRGALPWSLLIGGFLLSGFLATYLAARESHTRSLARSNVELSSAVAERTRAETALRSVLGALRASEARLETVIENLPFDLCVCDADGRVTMANPSAVKHWGDALGRSPEDPDFPGPLRDAWNAGRARAIAGEVVRGELEYVRELRSYEHILAPIRDAQGVLGILAVLNDVTERRHAESERAAVEAQLQRTQKLESLGVLAGGIAHDFNNLLTAMLGNTGLAISELEELHPARPYLQHAVHACERAADLTRQMLAYAGKGRFELRPIQLSQHVREIAHLSATGIPKKVALHLDLAPQLPAIEADAAQIHQLVMNLVLNGAEACGDGPGEVRITTRLVQLDRALERQHARDGTLPAGEYVCLEVTDTGAGMDAATQARIFEPFFSTKFTGRGLGLAAVLGIVRSHRGSIEVASEPGHGSSFRVYLPTTKDAPVSQRSDAPDAFVGQGVVLVIDDERVVREVACRSLERAGYHVLSAANGHEGLELFRARSTEVDLVLLDMTMPDMNGEETLRAMREVRADVRALLSSGYNESEAAGTLASDGAVGFIHKPYTPTALANKVRTALGR